MQLSYADKSPNVSIWNRLKALRNIPLHKSIKAKGKEITLKNKQNNWKLECCVSCTDEFWWKRKIILLSIQIFKKKKTKQLYSVILPLKEQNVVCGFFLSFFLSFFFLFWFCYKKLKKTRCVLKKKQPRNITHSVKICFKMNSKTRLSNIFLIQVYYSYCYAIDMMHFVNSNR